MWALLLNSMNFPSIAHWVQFLINPRSIMPTMSENTVDSFN